MYPLIHLNQKKTSKTQTKYKKLSNQDSYIELSGNESRSTRLDSDMNSTKPKKLLLAKQKSMFNHPQWQHNSCTHYVTS